MNPQKILYWSDENPVGRDYVIGLLDRYGRLDGRNLLEVFLQKEMPGKIALVSSFGAEAALLLQMTAAIDPATPVIFIDTLRHFPETLRYRDLLIEKFKLTNVESVGPDSIALARHDPDGTLWQFNPDQCCALRKVEPLHNALESYRGWITGRKRAHGGLRQNLPLIEISDGRLKLNPLANWTTDQIAAAFDKLNLPRHPLYKLGYYSIGCSTCTARTSSAAAPREGRWPGSAKTECGIHLENGRLKRTLN